MKSEKDDQEEEFCAGWKFELVNSLDGNIGKHQALKTEIIFSKFAMLIE